MCSTGLEFGSRQRTAILKLDLSDGHPSAHSRECYLPHACHYSAAVAHQSRIERCFQCDPVTTAFCSHGFVRHLHHLHSVETTTRSKLIAKSSLVVGQAWIAYQCACDVLLHVRVFLDFLAKQHTG